MSSNPNFWEIPIEPGKLDALANTHTLWRPGAETQPPTNGAPQSTDFERWRRMD